jgi:trk system potassium uptake protein TrkA
LRIVLIGASTLALTATEALLAAGHQVVIVEKNREVIEEVSKDYDCSFIHGDGSRPHILEDVDPKHTDCLFCLSNEDTSNILAAVVARSLGFEKVVVRIEDRDLLPICTQLDLDHVIVPDKRVSRELVAFAEGNERALDTEAADDTGEEEADAEAESQP